MTGSARLFVYGTLRKGARHPLAHGLARVARHEGRASCAGCLYVIEDAYPGLVDAPDDSRVVGDLFVLDDPEAAFARLDAYEGDEYQREQRNVTREDGSRVTAWVYVYRAEVALWPRLASGDWLASR